MSELLIAMYLTAEFCRIRQGWYPNGQYAAAEVKERWLYDWTFADSVRAAEIRGILGEPDNSPKIRKLRS